jgi:hypothetical protein
MAILKQNEYHSPELSDSDDEDRIRVPGDKKFLHVYDRPWRSEKVIIIYIYYDRNLTRKS